MKSPKRIKASPDALYTNEAEALSAPGSVWKHYKGGVYRQHFRARIATDQPLVNGDEVFVYEHIFPNEHGMWVRPVGEWSQHVESAELEYTGPRFKFVNMNSQDSDPELFVCDCHTTEHMFTFSYDTDSDPLWRTAYLHVHLNSGGFLQRLKKAFLYLFGYKSKYGDFDEVVLGERQLRRLKSVVDNALNHLVDSKDGSKSN